VLVLREGERAHHRRLLLVGWIFLELAVDLLPQVLGERGGGHRM
jgi:hypothetical protein